MVDEPYADIACIKCRFYHVIDEPGRDREDYFGLGECRRYAPRPIVPQSEDDLTEWKWVMVMDTDWCGEFQEWHK